MTAAHLAAADRALLVIAEACERADRSARDLRREGAPAQLVDALEAADRKLTSAYNELRRAAYFPAAGDEQLRLAG